MKKIKILLTAAGCPGASTLIKMLKGNGEREVETIGVDCEKEVIGRFWCDKFFQAPLSDSEEYIPFLLDICEKEKPDLIFPQSSYDVYPISVNREKFEKLGVKVLVSDPEPIEIANDKYKMYEALRGTGVAMPRYFFSKTLPEFKEAVFALGYPNESVCFKPPVSKGSRGFRYINPKADRRDQLLNQKPQDNKHMSLSEFEEIFKDDQDFPGFLVMEVAAGPEYDVMALCDGKEPLLITVKTREKQRWGVITSGELVRKKDLEEAVSNIVKKIPLKYNISFQFIGDKLIEINPRTSSYIYQDDLIEPYLAIKLLLGEIAPEEVKKYQEKIRYGRRMLRYMDQIFF